MKYLKLFENEEVRKVGRYFVDDMSRADLYYIFRVDKQIGEMLELTKIYRYDIEVGELEAADQIEEKYELPLRDFVIIFESNTLKKAKDYLMMIVDVKKYNL